MKSKSISELIKALTGLPAKVFWEPVETIEARLPEYERQWHERPDRRRAVGGGVPMINRW
jgi:hypothetical protein